jgi:hypothetical protein
LSNVGGVLKFEYFPQTVFSYIPADGGLLEVVSTGLDFIESLLTVLPMRILRRTHGPRKCLFLGRILIFLIFAAAAKSGKNLL